MRSRMHDGVIASEWDRSGTRSVEGLLQRPSRCLHDALWDGWVVSGHSCRRQKQRGGGQGRMTVMTMQTAWAEVQAAWVLLLPEREVGEARGDRAGRARTS